MKKRNPMARVLRDPRYGRRVVRLKTRPKRHPKHQSKPQERA